MKDVANGKDNGHGDEHRDKRAKAEDGTEAETLQPGQTVVMDILSLKPGAIAVGHQKMKAKAKKMKDMKRDELEKYMQKQLVSVIRGPGGRYHIVDKHHHCLAAYHIGQKTVNVTIVKFKWIKPDQDNPDEAFWSKMKEKVNVWEFDEAGGPACIPQALPADVSGLKDDPYISLAAEARKGNKDIDKPKTEFEELALANRLRTLNLNSSNTKDGFDKSDIHAARKILETSNALPLKMKPMKNIMELRPGQMAVGLQQVKFKADLMKKMEPLKELEDYMLEKVVPVVMGPGKKLHIKDHHHHCRAALDAKQQQVYITVEEDWSALGEQEFWTQMQAGPHPKVWQFDENGRPAKIPQDLPTDVQGLKDDPYRSLAAVARKHAKLDKSPTDFAEFAMANVLRTKIPVLNRTNNIDGFDDSDRDEAAAILLAMAPVKPIGTAAA